MKAMYKYKYKYKYAPMYPQDASAVDHFRIQQRRPLAYVANRKDNTLSVIDKIDNTVFDTMIQHIKVGNSPTRIAIG
jgi:YVTN family beta-propeller protein